MSQRRPNRCENCLHWIGVKQFNRLGQPQNFKFRCERILGSQRPNIQLLDEIAVVYPVDAPVRAGAEIYTSWNFYCNLHEKKEIR